MPSICLLTNQTATGDTCPADWPVISLQQNVAKTVSIALLDNDGNAITTDVEPEEPGGSDPITSSSSSPLLISFGDAEITEISEAKLWIKQHQQDAQVVEITGEYAGNGEFTFDVSKDNVAKPGLYLGSVLLFDGDDNPVFVKNIYVEIEQNATDDTLYNYPLTIAEIRLALRDTCPDANFLLDDIEFSNREIQYAMRRPIDMFNECQPAVVRYNYNNFPYRYNWTEATIGYLLEIAAFSLRRNSLDYNAGGASINDKGRWETYLAVSRDKITEYRRWCTQEQVRENIKRGFGGFSGRWCR